MELRRFFAVCRNRLAWCLWTLLCCVPLRAGWAAPEPVALDREPALRKEVSVSVKEEPIAGVLARLSGETGAALGASEDTADERITLFARRRPAHEVLAMLAEHLDYTWDRQFREGVPRLVLTQTIAAKRREQALRQAHGDTAELRRLLEEQVALASGPEARALAKLSLEECRRRYQQNDERLHGRLVARREGNTTTFDRERSQPAPERQQAAALRREQRVLAILRPVLYGRFHPLDVAARIYGVLAPEAREAFWRGEPLSFAFPQERGRLALSREVAFGVAAGGLGGMLHREDPETGLDYTIPCQSVDRVRGTMQLEVRGAEKQLKIRVRALGAVGEDGQTQKAERVFNGDLPGYPDRPRKTGPRLDASAKALRQPVTLPLGNPAAKDGNTQFADLLERLAERTSLPVLADGYMTGELMGPFTADRRPLAEVLEKLCRIFDRNCRSSRGYLLLRHEDWAVRRAMEPPARRMAHWEAAIQRRGALSLGELLEIANELTPEQAEVLLQRWDGRVPEGLRNLLEADLEQSGDMLRLLQTLPSPMRKALTAGRGTSIGSLPPRAVYFTRRLVEDAAQRMGGLEHSPRPDGQQFIPGSGFEYEDRLEAAWTRGVLRLRRAPQSWIFGGPDWFPPEERAEALELERLFKPKATDRDLRRVDGERVQVSLEVPGAAPVVHLFLVSIPD